MNPLKVKEDEIRKWFKTCDSRIAGHSQALFRAAVFLFNRQTQAERMSESTRITNNRGLNKPDAPFVTWVVKTFSGKELPNKVAIKLKFRLAKYARQLVDLATHTKGD